jgi:hypothetical protein
MGGQARECWPELLMPEANWGDVGGKTRQD